MPSIYFNSNIIKRLPKCLLLVVIEEILFNYGKIICKQIYKTQLIFTKHYIFIEDISHLLLKILPTDDRTLFTGRSLYRAYMENVFFNNFPYLSTKI